jgi:hypothetical protein
LNFNEIGFKLLIDWVERKNPMISAFSMTARSEELSLKAATNWAICTAKFVCANIVFPGGTLKKNDPRLLVVDGLGSIPCGHTDITIK